MFRFVMSMVFPYMTLFITTFIFQKRSNKINFICEREKKTEKIDSKQTNKRTIKHLIGLVFRILFHLI